MILTGDFNRHCMILTGAVCDFNILCVILTGAVCDFNR